MVEPELVMLVTKIPCNSISKKQSELLNVEVNYTYRGPAARGRLGTVVTQKTILTEFDEIGSTRKEVYVDLPASDMPASLYTDITGMPLAGCEPKSGYGIKVYALDLNGKPEWGSMNVLTVTEVVIEERWAIVEEYTTGGHIESSPPPKRIEAGKWYYDYGTRVTLTAVPSSGYKWVRWEGEVANPNINPTYMIMDQNRGDWYQKIRAEYEIEAVAESPIITPLPAINITHDSATLKATLVRTGYCSIIMCYIEWGMTTAYGYKSPEYRLYPGEELAVDIAGLTPNTTYHFRAVAAGRCVTPPLIGYGSDMTFTTSAEVVKGFTMRVINPPAGATHWIAGAVAGGTLPYMKYRLPIYETWVWDKDVPDYAINFHLMVVDAAGHSLHSKEWDWFLLRDGKNYVYNCATWQMMES